MGTNIENNKIFLLEKKAIEQFEKIKTVHELAGWEEVHYQNLFLVGFWCALYSLNRNVDGEKELNNDLTTLSQSFRRDLEEKEVKAVRLGYKFGNHPKWLNKRL
jgi:Pyruvate/2-oxoacid:ferredoxin oxidoreductase gamma subunit